MGRKISVLGAGAYGTALGQILTENGHEVTFYDPKRELTLEEALEGAEVVVLAVPSGALPEFMPTLPKEVLRVPLVVATKGLLSGEMFADFADWQVLSGPGFAKDIMAHKKTFLTASGKLVSELFTRPYLVFDFTEDREGILMCGALKNVYAILAGRLGLVPETPEMAAYLTEVEEEMRLVLAANGAKAETVDLECGQGDLRLTCDYPSRNFQFGLRLREDPEAKPEVTVEGVSALKRIRNGEIEVPEKAFRLRYLVEEGRKWG